MRPACFLLFLSLFALGTSPAQTVTYKSDTIYVDGQPYAIMKKHGAVVPDYSVRTLDNKEIMMVRFNKGEGGTQQYVVSFISSGVQTTMKPDIGFGKKLAKEIVENHVVKSGDIDPNGEKRFLLAYPPAGSNTELMPGMVQRDRAQDIFIAGKKIMQANVVIGHYKKSVSPINGELYNVFLFYLPNGAMIAEATLKQFNCRFCKLYTFRDNQEWSISVRSDMDFDQVKEISVYLSLHYYL